MRRALALAPFGIALVVAYAVKRFYSSAGPAELDFALAPTTWLVTQATGEAFFFEKGVGYVSPELGLAVVPGCAGLNFMVVVFLALVFGFGDRLERGTQRLALVAASAFAAYATTLPVNAARIAGSRALFARLEPLLELEFDEVHRVVGVAIYVGALLALVGGVARLPPLRRARR